MMANYQEERDKLTNTHLKSLKSTAKNTAGTIFRIDQKNFQYEELPRKLFAKASQNTKIRNAFANNISTDIKLSKAQLSKIIQSGRFLRNILGNLGKKVMKYLATALAKDNLLGLISNLPSNAINKSERKIGGKGVTIYFINFELRYE